MDSLAVTDMCEPTARTSLATGNLEAVDKATEEDHGRGWELLSKSWPLWKLVVHRVGECVGSVGRRPGFEACL